MDTYLKLTSVKNNKNCNCISPFYINDITGINPHTGRDYSKEDLDAMKTALYRISAAKGCNVSVCCDPDDPTTNPNPEFTKQFKQKFPKIMPLYEGSRLKGIKLSTRVDVKESGWQDPNPYMICKITKAKIIDTPDPNIKIATNLVNDCYSNNCSSLEVMTVKTLLQNAKADMNYTYFDDARVTQAILENNISYVKEFIRKYKKVDMPLTNDDYNNRMIHIAAGSNNNEILTMLIALKAKLNVQNKLRETPIQFAIRAKNLDNISSLLSQGVDLTIPNKDGETPMFYAMKTGDMRIVNMLYTNNSPIQGVDKDGNNLIHYCILHCPSYKENDDTVPNSKGEIIQFLIEHGISTEQKNKAGITPLELTSRQINKELNKECADTNAAEQAQVIEKFFNVKAAASGSNMNGGRREHFSNGGGAIKQDISEYTPEHIALLDIQTKLFNNILRNNPKKYGGYISVDDIPKGAPIEVLDTVCVGENITGNEDTEECIAKGGRISKIKNKTTKIKLELIPEEESQIDQLKQKDLYYPKQYDKIPVGTVPNNISSYNASVKASGNILPNTTAAQTPGITYNIGESSTNVVSTPTTMNTPATAVAPAAPAPATAVAPAAPAPAPAPTVATPVATEHPNIIEEDNTVVRKCKKDAIRNSAKIAQTTMPAAMSAAIPSTTSGNTIGNLYNTYKLPINIIAVVIILLIALLIYLSITGNSNNVSV
jgi:ankyrin repeat protein